MTIVTPLQVEARLKDLSKLIDEAHNNLVDSEMLYHASKATYEVSMARSRIELAGKSDAGGRNRTVGEREDLALMANEELHKKSQSAKQL
jgi:hypothetical protein